MGCASSSEAAAVPTPAPTQKPSGNGSAVQLKLHDEAASSSNVTNLAFKKRSSDLSDSGEITSERDEILGGGKQNKLMARAEKISMGVLPLLKSFERFDVDKSGGLSVDELRDALEDLGIVTTKEFATRVLQQYDQYPDQVIDIKEFATCVREIKLMLEFDNNGDGVIDAEELLPMLHSLGLTTLDQPQVQRIMDRFDVDRSGTIDLVELSSLVRTAKAFMRYDTDNSGAIDHEELRDALRKLGIHAGSLESDVLFRRYDTDGNGALELDEFAVLVCDLQLYASFDTDCDGSIDVHELQGALRELGFGEHPAASSATEAAKVLEAWDEDLDGRLNVSEFTRFASDVSAFRDFDRDGDMVLARSEFSGTLIQLAVEVNPLDAFDKYSDVRDAESDAPKAVSLVGFGNAMRELLTTTASFRHREGKAVTISAELSNDMALPKLGGEKDDARFIIDSVRDSANDTPGPDERI